MVSRKCAVLIGPPCILDNYQCKVLDRLISDAQRVVTSVPILLFETGTMHFEYGAAVVIEVNKIMIECKLYFLLF